MRAVAGVATARKDSFTIPNSGDVSHAVALGGGPRPLGTCICHNERAEKAQSNYCCRAAHILDLNVVKGAIAVRRFSCREFFHGCTP